MGYGVRSISVGTFEEPGPAVFWQQRFDEWITLRLQLVLIAISFVLGLGLNPLMLDLQKRIINQAIGQRNFDALLWLCGGFLGAVVFDGTLHLVGEGLRGAFEPAPHVVDERRIETTLLSLDFLGLVLLGTQPDPRVERQPLGFILGQIIGATAATALFRWLVPQLPDTAARVVVPKETAYADRAH